MCIIKAYDLSVLSTVFLSPSQMEPLVSPESVNHVLLNTSLLVNNIRGKIITWEPSVWCSPWVFFFISPHCMLKEVNRGKILIILLFTDYRISFIVFILNATPSHTQRLYHHAAPSHSLFFFSLAWTIFCCVWCALSSPRFLRGNRDVLYTWV